MDLNTQDYERTVIAFSGGKDSTACLIWAIENDCPNIELWHHDVDGREGSNLMDWPVTTDYCKHIAETFNVPIYFSWLSGGFEREMLRDNQKKACTYFETPDGLSQAGGTRGKDSTRLQFPQVSGDLKIRWCSAYLKIDVCDIAIRNQARFNHSKTLLISGERAQESPQRAKYKEFELDRSDNRSGRNARHVDRLRPIHKWTEDQVWDAIKRHRINAHPAYYLGWGRLSCMTCIFGSKNQWATILKIDGDRFERIAEYEVEFNKTIQRDKSVEDMAEAGEAYIQSDIKYWIDLAMSKTYMGEIRTQHWTLPAGAFGESAGPV